MPGKTLFPCRQIRRGSQKESPNLQFDQKKSGSSVHVQLNNRHATARQPELVLHTGVIMYSNGSLYAWLVRAITSAELARAHEEQEHPIELHADCAWRSPLARTSKGLAVF